MNSKNKEVKIGQSIISKFSSGSSTHTVAPETTSGFARPSSPRSVGMRDIGAGPHGCSAKKSCGLTPCVARKGFTLIELLVVVLIIGILAAVALPQYQKAVEKSRAAEAFSVLRALNQAQETYYLQNGTYSDTLENLDVEIPSSQFFSYSVGMNNGRPMSLQASRNTRDYTIAFRLNNFVDDKHAHIVCYPTASYPSAAALARAKEICKNLGADITKNENPTLYRWVIVP